MRKDGHLDRLLPLKNFSVQNDSGKIFFNLTFDIEFSIIWTNQPVSQPRAKPSRFIS